MIVWSLFIISHMGLFVYTQKGSIISMVDLPTTEIIEPIYKEKTLGHRLKGFHLGMLVSVFMKQKKKAYRERLLFLILLYCLRRAI